jgi:hypothetical protein
VHLVIKAAEPGLMDVGINLGCADVGMAKHGLDGAEISPVIEEMGGEGMPEHVGADRLGAQARHPGVALQQAPEVLAAEAFAPLSHE